MSLVRRLLDAVHPEGIPWPCCLLYDRISRSGALHKHYVLLADELAAMDGWESLLDVGTGPGRLLLEIHERRPGVRLTGVDISPGMVRRGMG